MITFDRTWSVEHVEKSYNTESQHSILKIILSKLGINKIICFSVDKTALLNFPIDPFGITEIMITFRQSSKSGQIYLKCEEILESTIINCYDIEIK
jgi:hypothetical protein